MLTIACAADVNVLGYEPWSNEKRPWISILAKGDDQVYIGDKAVLELLKPHFSLVYALDSQLEYLNGNKV